MRVRSFPGCRLLAYAAALAAGTISGCSQNEDSPLAPAPIALDPNSQGPASTVAKKPLADDLDLKLPDEPRARRTSPDDRGQTSGAASPGTLDTRFGAGDVEKTVRTAMRAARNGETAKAAVLLDQVLAADPSNREAMMMKAALTFEQWQKEKSPEARGPIIEKAVARARALRAAYEELKPQEMAMSSAILYGYAQYLCESGRIDEAVKAVDESAEGVFDPYFLVAKDEKMAALRKTPQFQAALKAHDAARLAKARERAKEKLAEQINIPFQFTHRDLNLKPVSLSDFKGKVVLVDFWGTWCGPCKQTIPHLIDLYQNRKDKGLVVIGLDYEKGIQDESKARELVKPFAKEVKMTYPCVITDDATIQQIPGFKGFPTFVVVDRGGKVRLAITEPDDDSLELIRDVIEVLLEEPAPAAEPAKKPAADPKAKAP